MPTRVLDRPSQERVRDASPAVSRPDVEADDRPHGPVIDLRDGPASIQTPHRAARPESAPADGQVAKVCDNAGDGLGSALFAQRRPVRVPVRPAVLSRRLSPPLAPAWPVDHRLDVVEALDRRRSNDDEGGICGSACARRHDQSVWRKRIELDRRAHWRIRRTTDRLTAGVPRSSTVGLGTRSGATGGATPRTFPIHRAETCGLVAWTWAASRGVPLTTTNGGRAAT
jgi:hypothetical protein